MRVAEHREPVGAQLDALGDGVQARVHRLKRPAVQQVEVQIPDSCASQQFDAPGSLIEALEAIDRALDRRIEALNAEAHAVDAAETQSFRHGLGQSPRGDLHGDLGVGQHEVGIAQRADEVGESVRRHDRRCAATEVDV